MGRPIKSCGCKKTNYVRTHDFNSTCKKNMGFLNDYELNVTGPPKKIRIFSPYACVVAKLLQSCLTLCDPMGCSPPGSSVHGILQARTMEWVAMPSSRGSS